MPVLKRAAMPECELPDWLEEKRISEAAMADAYAFFPATCRAAIKTGIALAHFHFGAKTENILQWRESENLGLGISVQTAQVPVALLCLDAKLTAAARICAAAILPVLAGVPRIVAAFVNGQPAQAALLTLELCGIEHIYCLKPADLVSLAASLPNQARIVMLHEAEEASLQLAAQLRNIAAKLAIPFYENGEKPSLLLKTPDCFDCKVLEFCQGSLPDTDATAQVYDAIYSDQKDCHEARLALRPGCEGFWLYPGLTPDFFRNSQVAASLNPG